VVELQQDPRDGRTKRGILTRPGVIAKLAQKDETAHRLCIPGFGPITTSAMAATIQDTSSFAGAREFAAVLGLTPRQNLSGDKPKLGRISKMGNRNLRKPLVVAAHAPSTERVQPSSCPDATRRP
jgi:transposase